MAPRRVLHLIYRGNLVLVHPGGHRVQLGRDDGSDIVILSLFASRRHAEVRAEGGQFLLVDRFTVADLNVASVLYRLLFFDGLGKYSQVKAWMDRCWARPAAQKCRKMRES